MVGTVEAAGSASRTPPSSFRPEGLGPGVEESPQARKRRVGPGSAARAVSGRIAFPPALLHPVGEVPQRRVALLGTMKVVETAGRAGTASRSFRRHSDRRPERAEQGTLRGTGGWARSGLRCRSSGRS